jgi:hypothetical protein
LLTITALFSAVHATPAGIAAAVDIDVVSNIKNYIVPQFVETLNNLDMEDIVIDGGSVSNITFNFDPINSTSIVTDFKGSANAIQMSVADISGEFKGNFSYKFWIFKAKGTFKVTLEKGSTTMEMIMPFTSQQSEGRMLPAIGMDSFKFDIDSSKIIIDISGNVLADLASAFISVFKRLIMSLITSKMNSMVPT